MSSRHLLPPYTPLSFREQFRLRRLGITYHDLRAFATSWVPLPVFAVYRIFLPIYLAGWMIAHIVARRDTDGAHWLIYITNWSFALFLAVQTFAAVVTIFYMARPSLLAKEARNDGIIDGRNDSGRCGDCDGINWIVKLFWLLYITSQTATVMICLGFWSTQYTPCSYNNEFNYSSNATGELTGSNGTKSYGPENCGADIFSIHAHGINGLLAVGDVLFSLIPFHVLHIVYPCLYTVIYVAFSVVYFAAGGKTETGERYIYSLLNYGENTLVSTLAALFLICAPVFVYTIPLLVACVRNKLYTVITNHHRNSRNNVLQVNGRENHFKPKWKFNFFHPHSRPLSQSSSVTV